jgi:hypothetical protein
LLKLGDNPELVLQSPASPPLRPGDYLHPNDRPRP